MSSFMLLPCMSSWIASKPEEETFLLYSSSYAIRSCSRRIHTKYCKSWNARQRLEVLDVIECTYVLLPLLKMMLNLEPDPTIEVFDTCMIWRSHCNLLSIQRFQNALGLTMFNARSYPAHRRVLPIMQTYGVVRVMKSLLRAISVAITLAYKSFLLQIIPEPSSRFVGIRS
jgi:hypothetical protein